MTDLWTAVKDLPVAIERIAFIPLAPSGPTGMDDHETTELHLAGRGATGLGEQVGMAETQAGLRAGDWALEGEWATLEDFLGRLDEVDVWPVAPEHDLERHWRRWTFESAALDLALRQAGTSLPEALGRTARPLTFVTSFGLGDPPDIDKVAGRRARHPTVGFKLDVAPSWTQEIMERVAAVEGVATIDFKGQYGIEIEDEAALVRMYERALATFPDAVLEDPHDVPAVRALLQPHAERVSYDAPVTSVEALEATPIAVGIVNVKPCRVGRLRELSRLYAHCDAAGVRMYNGGMGELGVGRGQAQLLAALFHPDAPNDIAPSDYNLEDAPPGLPASPLDPAPDRGFRRR